MVTIGLHVRVKSNRGYYGKVYSGQSAVVIDAQSFDGVPLVRLEFADGERLWFYPDEIKEGDINA